VAREFVRLPVGPAAPRIPNRMAVPSACHLVEPGVLPRTKSWDGQFGGRWLLVAEEEVHVPVPPEFFLRELLPLDANDAPALASWCARWGVPPLPAFVLEEQLQVVVRTDVSHLFESAHPDHAPSVAGTVVEPSAAGAPSANHLAHAVDAAMRAAGAQATYLYEDQLYIGHSNTHWRGVPLAVARIGVQMLQGLVRWWTLVVPPEITIEWLSEVEPDIEYFLAWLPFGVPANQLEGLDYGLSLLNALLADAGALRVRAISACTGEDFGHHPVDVNGLVALELARYIDDKIPARQCANETCPNMYVRQTGRAKHDQHRTHATKYCSNKCARAQAERARRRRIAASKAAASQAQQQACP